MFKKCVYLILFLVGLNQPVWSVDCFDHGVWTKILEANVDDQGLVDYDGVRINKGGNILEYLTFVEIETLKTCTSQEKLIFWINAYNANALRLVSGKEPLEMVGIDHPYNKKRFYAGNKKLSLFLIKERILRSDVAKGGPIEGLSVENFDPRIHFALVNATKGAPQLPSKAFESKDFEEQLENLTKFNVNLSKFVRIENFELILSEVFWRYAKDFESVGGVVEFIKKYLDPNLRPDAEKILAKLKTDYPDVVRYEYDWSINRQKK